MSAQPFSAWNAVWRDSYATILLVLPKRDGGWESTQEDGGKPVWRSARQTGVRHGSAASASLIFLNRPHPRPMDAVFCPVAQSRFDPAVQAMICSLAIPSFCPIVSWRVLLRSCCFFQGKRFPHVTNRTSAFALPLLQGLGCLSAASCRGHRATDSRAACLAQLAAQLVD